MNEPSQKHVKPKKAWPNIRRRGNSWQVDCGEVNGKRIQFSFKTEMEAVAEAERRKLERVQYGEAAFLFTPEQRQISLEAFKILQDHPEQSLVDAARFYAEHHDANAEKRTIRQLLDEFLESKRSSGKAQRTIKDYSDRLTRLAASFGTTLAHNINPQELESWLNKIGCSGTNRQNYRRCLIILFNFAVRRGYCKNNPAVAVEKVKVTKGLPVILTTTEVSQLLKTAQEKAFKILPYFCLGFFAGLRPEEIRRLDWRNINFDRKEIYVAHTASKTGTDRYVAMSDNLIAWLLPHRQSAGKLYFSKKLFDRSRSKAEIPWANDVMRHTYASHHCPIHGTIETADQMGHKGMSVLFKHYRRAVTKTDAEKYWQILPQPQPKEGQNQD